MPEVRIACAADAAYVPVCAAMLGSLLTRHPAGVTVHLLHTPDLAPGPVAALRGLVERGGGRWEPLVVAEDAVAGLPRLPRIPSLMWLRVLLPELLPRADRVLYLDADTLALQPLDHLWQTDLGPALVGAVDNVLHPDMAGRPAALGLPSGARYFNSGVLLMDLAAWRREGIAGRIVDCARRRAAELLWPDQDALNVVLAGRRLALHPRWNCQNSFFYWPRRSREMLGAAALDEALAQPAILHFEGPGWAKPWHFFSDHPFRDVWRASLTASGWPLPQPQAAWQRMLGRLPLPVVGAARGLLRYPRPQPAPRRRRGQASSIQA